MGTLAIVYIVVVTPPPLAGMAAMTVPMKTKNFTAQCEGAASPNPKKTPPVPFKTNSHLVRIHLTLHKKASYLSPWCVLQDVSLSLLPSPSCLPSLNSQARTFCFSLKLLFSNKFQKLSGFCIHSSILSCNDTKKPSPVKNVKEMPWD